MHDKTKTTESTITKLATEIVHHDTSPTNTGLKVKVTGSKSAQMRSVGQHELCTLSIDSNFTLLRFHLVGNSNSVPSGRLREGLLQIKVL